MASSIYMDRGWPVQMRDGAVLRADVYRLDDGQKHPAILMRCPYDRRRIADSAYLNLLGAVSAGYAIVVQNVRGTFDSEGKWDEADVYGTIEGPDGYDTIESIAAEPWCDGNVGTAGASYLGFLQWVLAKENPPHLRAIAPWSCGTAGVGEVALRHGVVELNVMVNWITMMGLDMANRLAQQGKDVSRMQQMLGQAAAHPDQVYNYLPLKDVPHFDFDGVRDLWRYRALNPIPGPEYETKGRPSYGQVMVPGVHISGWFDFFTWGTFENFQSMRDRGGSPAARAGQHILVGPWGHGGPTSAMGAYGGIHFGMRAGLGARVSEYNLGFFDKYVRGWDTALPAVRYYVMGRDVWREADTWPLPQTQWRRFFLRSQGRANTASGNGVLDRDQPGSEPPDQYVYDPMDPAPTTGHRGHELNGFVAGPQDQYRLERRQDVLCYSTAELERDVEVTGPLALHLYASSSARDTDFAARLCDVYPDGSSYNVASGILRARYRKSYFTPQWLTPGEVNEYVLDLGHTSQLFRKGHRIRMDISSSNFPEFDRNMNTGNPVGEDAWGVPATQTIFHQSGCASCIDLPIIPE